MVNGLDIAILAGQSNMAGRGPLNTVEEIRDERILVRTHNCWEVMKEPIHNDSGSAGIGPGASFAKKYVDFFNREIGLVPCASGGTSITQWQPGGKLLNNLLKESFLPNDKIVAVLWAQGETDSRIRDNAFLYDEYFEKMTETIDKKLGTYKVPVLMADIPPFYYNSDVYCYADVVSEKIKKICSNSERFVFVKSDGLVSRGDGLHYDSASYRELGTRFFNNFIKSLNK